MVGFGLVAEAMCHPRNCSLQYSSLSVCSCARVGTCPSPGGEGEGASPTGGWGGAPGLDHEWLAPEDMATKPGEAPTTPRAQTGRIGGNLERQRAQKGCKMDEDEQVVVARAWVDLLTDRKTASD